MRGKEQGWQAEMEIRQNERVSGDRAETERMWGRGETAGDDRKGERKDEERPGKEE